MICKPYTSSPAPAVDCSAISFLDTRQSEQLNLIPTAAPSCENAQPTDGFQTCACTRETFGCSIHPNTRDEWIACMRDSLASLTQSLASERAKLTSAIYGPTPHGYLASYDRDSRSWKTCQESFLPDTSGPSSETLPRWGMTRAGQLFPLPMLVLHTGETDGGASLNVPTPCTVDAGSRFNQSASDGAALRPTLGAMARFNMWPTPRANDAEKRGDFDATNPRNGLPAAVKLWPTPTSSLGTKGGRVTPRKSREGGTLIEAVSARAFPTPTARDYRTGDKPESRRARMKASGEWPSPNLNDIAAPGGKLNPMWVEWLMGWPLAFTVSKPSATAKSRSRRRSPGESSGDRE